MKEKKVKKVKKVKEVKEPPKAFEYTDTPDGKLKETPSYDLTALYERAHEELSLQQAKRDQIITIYLALFSFMIPFAMSAESLNWQNKGYIFLALGIIGILFSLIIIRYKVYKDVYWLCCKSLTVLNNYKIEEMDKATVQSVFYTCLKKSGKKFLTEDNRFDSFAYCRKNLFSAETMHFMIQDTITSIIIGLGTALVLPFSTLQSVVLGTLAGIVIFAILLAEFFKKSRALYNVLVDGYDDSFNAAFSKAWFLHFYVDE